MTSGMRSYHIAYSPQWIGGDASAPTTEFSACSADGDVIGGAAGAENKLQARSPALKEINFCRIFILSFGDWFLLKASGYDT